MGEQDKIYHAKTQRGVLLWSLFFYIFSLLTAREITWLISILLIGIVAIILAMFMKFFFSIRDDKVIFKVFLFNKVIYKKQVDHSMIKKSCLDESIGVPNKRLLS